MSVFLSSPPPGSLGAPLSSLRAGAATLMAAVPARQRCGSVSPRAKLSPCYYEGYLEKRGPKEKVGVHSERELPNCQLPARAGMGEAETSGSAARFVLRGRAAIY